MSAGSGLVRGSNGPPRTGHLAGLVEEAALRTGEGDLLARAHPAPLELLLARGGLHDVMPTVFVYGHVTFCPTDASPRGQRVASGPWIPLPPPNSCCVGARHWPASRAPDSASPSPSTSRSGSKKYCGSPPTSGSTPRRDPSTSRTSTASSRSGWDRWARVFPAM